jgi:hypothetical protein
MLFLNTNESSGQWNNKEENREIAQNISLGLTANEKWSSEK